MWLFRENPTRLHSTNLAVFKESAAWVTVLMGWWFAVVFAMLNFDACARKKILKYRDVIKLNTVSVSFMLKIDPINEWVLHTFAKCVENEKKIENSDHYH